MPVHDDLLPNKKPSTSLLSNSDASTEYIIRASFPSILRLTNRISAASNSFSTARGPQLSMEYLLFQKTQAIPVMFTTGKSRGCFFPGLRAAGQSSKTTFSTLSGSASLRSARKRAIKVQSQIIASVAVPIKDSLRKNGGVREETGTWFCFLEVDIAVTGSGREISSWAGSGYPAGSGHQGLRVIGVP
jgi:hypothetical protein